MDSRVKSAPLTLLMGGTASETLISLRLLLDGEFVVAHSSAPNASSFEIVYQGLSLRLVVSAQVPDLAVLKKIFCNIDAAMIRSGIDISLGEHVAGGERVPAIVQGLLGVAQRLGSSLGAVATVWHPAMILSGFGYFSKAVADYLEGGAFPVLAMVDFKAAPDRTVTTSGLGFLAGQELQIDGGSMEQGELMRWFVQAAHDMATNAAIQPVA